jgi:hypothetical protein
MSDPVGEGVCFPGSGAGDDQKRCADMPAGSNAVLDRSPLLRIQAIEIGNGARRKLKPPRLVIVVAR